MGKNHARVYGEIPGVELVGVADADAALAARIAVANHTTGMTDYRELLSKNLDAVSIAVPTSVHEEVALAAADSGVNILVEKPIADTLQAASNIINRCQQKNVKLMIGLVERFNPVFGVVKKRIADLNVISINISRLGPLPPRIKDVGVVIDLATHDIDICRFLTNSGFRRVKSLITAGVNNSREDTALLSFEMDNGVLCHINTNWLTPFKVREITIAAREKYIKGWLMEQKVNEYEAYHDGAYVVREVPVPYGEPLKLELLAFIDAVANNKTPPITGEDGFKVLEIALECLRSGRRD